MNNRQSLRVLLISLQENLCAFGIRYIFHSVCKSKHKPVLFYPNLNYEISNLDNNRTFFSEFDKFLIEKQIDIVGISIMSYQEPIAIKLVKHIKNCFNNIVVIGGGVHVTAYPKDTLKYFDAICLGEGEISVVNFLDTYADCRADLAQIYVPGIVTKYNNEKKQRQSSPFLEDLDSLEILSLVDKPTWIYHKETIKLLKEEQIKYFDRYNGNSYDIITSRGCPLSCSYCADNIFKELYGNKWKNIRVRNVGLVIAEIKRALQKKPTIRFVNFHDDAFFSRPLEWLEEFVFRYKNEIQRPFMLRSIPGSITENKLKCLSQLNILCVSVGLQSGSYKILKNIYNRPIKIRTFTETIDKLHTRKITPVIDVMLNNPYEAKSDLVETIMTLSSLPKPFILELYGFTFYPGLEITSKAIEDNIIQDYDEAKTQFVIERDNSKVFLNKVISITPHFPRKCILYLMDKEDSIIISKVFPLILLVGHFLNFIYFIKMISKSQKNKIIGSFLFLFYTVDIYMSVSHVFPFLRPLLDKMYKKY